MGSFNNLTTDLKVLRNTDSACIQLEQEFKFYFDGVINSKENFLYLFRVLRGCLDSWESKCPNDPLLDMAKILVLCQYELVINGELKYNHDFKGAIDKYSESSIGSYDPNIGEWIYSRIIYIRDYKRLPESGKSDSHIQMNGYTYRSAYMLQREWLMGRTLDSLNDDFKRGYEKSKKQW